MLAVHSDPSGIDIWYAPLCEGDDSHDVQNNYWDALLPILSADEHLRTRLYPSKRDAILFVAARILLRTSLSQYVNVAPGCWSFGFTSAGRPFIASPEHEPELHFNLSHTDGMVVCAISRIREIGIDAEPIRRRTISMAMAKKYLAPAEFNYVENLRSEQRQNALLQFWTLKEAYIKASQNRRAIPFSALEFDLGNAEVHGPAMFSEGVDDDLSDWFFRQINLSEDHVCSLAYLSKSPEIIRVHKFMLNKFSQKKLALLRELFR